MVILSNLKVVILRMIKKETVVVSLNSELI